MAVRIKLATTPGEIDELFQVRHRVFVTEKSYFQPASDGRMLDRFDAFATTGNLVAVSDGRVVGGVRIVEPSSVGAPVDAFFDFRPYLPEGARAGSGSMLVMDPVYRRVPRVTFAMLGMMYYWALCKGLTHITGAVATEVEDLFLGSGYERIAERFFHEKSGNWMVPVMLRIDKLNDRFAAFVDKHNIRHFLQSFERQFHQKGEPIITFGETGSAAYVIVEGKVAVTVPSRASRPPQPTGDAAPASDTAPRSSRGPIPVREMGPGEVFGELSLITEHPRSANIVALTDVDLMVLEREAFHKQVAAKPEVALSLMTMIGNRMLTITDRLQAAAEG
jgi:CRP-like cAMP-binding protein